MPFHTLNPALAVLEDGRVMAYGNMGGDGQPQSQAAVFTRHVAFRQPLADAIDAPRWLLGRTWGSPHTNLRLEPRFDDEVIDRLLSAGHDVEVLTEPYSDTWAMPARSCCIRPAARRRTRPARRRRRGGGVTYPSCRIHSLNTAGPVSLLSASLI